MDIGLLTADKTCKNKLGESSRRYNVDGNPVYMVAALGVIHDKEKNT